MVKNKQKIVYAYVVADLLHIGHLKHLERASKLGTLIVGVLTDKATMEKKPEPTIPFEERAEMVEALKCVDYVIPQETYSPLDNVKSIKPDILMESTSHDEFPANNYVESYGGEIVISKYYKHQSSTAIKQKIKRV